jgi:hypothetical protein
VVEHLVRDPDGLSFVTRGVGMRRFDFAGFGTLRRYHLASKPRDQQEASWLVVSTTNGHLLFAIDDGSASDVAVSIKAATP